MATESGSDHLVKAELTRSAGISALGADQLMRGLALTDPKDREALQQYLRLLHLGGPLLSKNPCKRANCITATRA